MFVATCWLIRIMPMSVRVENWEREASRAAKRSDDDVGVRTRNRKKKIIRSRNRNDSLLFRTTIPHVHRCSLLLLFSSSSHPLLTSLNFSSTMIGVTFSSTTRKFVLSAVL